MIAQILLSIGILFCGIYAFRSHKTSGFVSLPSYVLAAVALFFVWSPGNANDIARAVGIGRGADLLLYMWVVFSALVVLNLHLRQRAQEALITKIVRAIALSGDQAGQSGVEGAAASSRSDKGRKRYRP